MVRYLLTGEKRPKGVLLQEILIASFAIFIVGPIAYWAFDRTPPQVRLRGVLLQGCPSDNHGDFSTCYVPDKIIPGSTVRVKYWTTKRQRADCPGVVQQEIISAQNTIFSKLGRPVGPAKWYADPDNPNEDIFIGQEVVIPNQIAPGPAVFISSTFRYCNWLQSVLEWPIVQIGPDIDFIAGERDRSR